MLIARLAPPCNLRNRIRVQNSICAFASIFLLLCSSAALAQSDERNISGWQLQDAAKIDTSPSSASTAAFHPQGWYAATVPGTVLTTLVDNKVYPEPLYGENMRAIPESLNKATYWYRTTFTVPLSYQARSTWLHFAGINYSAEVWVNGHQVGSILGAFIRGDFNITPDVKPGRPATLLVIIKPEPHPGIPHEHTIALGVGKNGGETAIDGPTFLSTIGWDWLPAVRDRDTGIWLPVTLSSTGPVEIKDAFVTSKVDLPRHTADLNIAATLVNSSDKPMSGTLTGTISGQGQPILFHKGVTIGPNSNIQIAFDSQAASDLHLANPKLWWPNGYGAPNLYHLQLEFNSGKQVSSTQSTSFGIRKIEYQVADSENLTISVNGVKIMVRGGDWGLDEAMKRVPLKRLDAQFHLHALANLNMIRNWVGQSTAPDFYDMADKYGMLLWDEFFQPNPNDGPDPTDIPTYMANVKDKVLRFRNHPSIAVWCARNEGYPPKSLDDSLKSMMSGLDPSRLYQSNSADGRGVSSHGPYYWRSPRFFYRLNESFKTETGSVSVPTIESIQGMMPKKDWETINDDWAQHDMARGAQRGDQYPFILARRYGHIRNLADFVRKAQLANYEAFRAMYEARNAEMFTQTTGILTWMSHPAQPSFVWQLYHYDLDPNAALYAVKKASETVHVQLNEANGAIQVINNRPDALTNLTVRETIYSLDGKVSSVQHYPVLNAPGSTTIKVGEIQPSTGISSIYFIKLDLLTGEQQLLSTNLYWQNAEQDDFTAMDAMPTANLQIKADSHSEGDNTIIHVTLTNPTAVVALMTHLQLHQKLSGDRVLPAFYSDNYISLVPGESRSLTIQAATADLATSAPLLLVDGFNVTVQPVEGPVSIAPNLNAQPSHWPASNLVP
jgi:mannosylglycoprotein endo-beta-mannosidase